MNEITRLVIWGGIVSLTLKAIDHYLRRRFPAADQPKSIALAARIELCSGGFVCLMALLFLSLGVISTVFNFVCVFLLLTGIAWIIMSWLLRRGNRHVRRYLLALSFLRLFIPVVGWIVSPLSFYLLFINRDAKKYFYNHEDPLQPPPFNFAVETDAQGGSAEL